MSFILFDPDEWETVVKTESYGEMFGVPMGSVSMSRRQRPPEEVKAIKERRQREHEDAVLAEAVRIQMRREMQP